MEEFKRKIRDNHPDLWPLLEEITTGKKIQTRSDLRQALYQEAMNAIMQRNIAMQEFVAMHGMNAAPLTLEKSGDPIAKKLMALARKNMKFKALIDQENQP
ncbi:MAG: hypothetical protein Q8P02_01585 [Candidatus Micrarchaeota archaeon]|nr:hypothetical protein [Candidatus Micrarchaeota archaeon]